MPPRSRNWVFTLNNPLCNLNLEPHQERVKYAAWQLEIGESGTPHYQGYIEFYNPQGLKGVKKIIGGEPHVEIRNGTDEEARNYAMKEDTREDGPWEFGTFVKAEQGKRTDWHNIRDMLVDGASNLDILHAYPSQFIRCYNGIRNAHAELMKEAARSSREVQVIVVVGEAGTGKTRCAMEAFPDIYKLDRGSSDAVWWDGYMGEKQVLIDEFYGYIPYGMLLQILDRYRLRLAVKCSHCYANWNTVIITSNKHPRYWYPEGLTPALSRRIHEIIEIPKDLDFEESYSFLAQKLAGVILFPANPPMEPNGCDLEEVD